MWRLLFQGLYMHLTTINLSEFSIRFGLALLFGSLIGLERQLRRHEAGLKTNALVCAGSAVFTMMAFEVGEPDRVVGNIVSGIGFLGAGMILRDGLHVRGLNTAATLWCSAAIGSLAGGGQCAHIVDRNRGCRARQHRVAGNRRNHRNETSSSRFRGCS